MRSFCLRTQLRHLSLDPPAWEVLVVDGGSEDKTIAILSEIKCDILAVRSAGDRREFLARKRQLEISFCFRTPILLA